MARIWRVPVLKVNQRPRVRDHGLGRGLLQGTAIEAIEDRAQRLEARGALRRLARRHDGLVRNGQGCGRAAAVGVELARLDGPGLAGAGLGRAAKALWAS